MTQPGTRQRGCGTMGVHRRLLDQVPSYPQDRDRIETMCHRSALRGRVSRRGVVRIPVVVHVVWNNQDQNISDAQIQSQIEVLNRDFRAQNPDVSQVPAVWQGVVEDPRIEFFLTTEDPNGNTHPGVTRTQTTVTSFTTDDLVKSADTGGFNPWPVDRYLNMWVCELRGGLLGYAQFPGGPAATDGVVITHDGFGTTGTASAPFKLGRTTTHEVGHWLNLFHIWGDDGTGCFGDDLVADTPNQGGSNTGCPTFPTVSCNNGPNGDMFMNYMDYVDDACMVMFTAGQVGRIDASLEAGRSSFLTTAAAFPEIEVNGAEVLGEIDQPGDADTYQFVAAAAGNYSIETSGSTDTFLTLFGPDSQTTLITIDDDSGSSLNSKITRTLSPGTYYASIRHYSPSQIGSYGISVSAFPEIEVNGAEVQGRIDQPGETDTYQFAATVAGNYIIETSGSTDTFLTLFGPDSQTTLITTDDDSGPSLNSKITRSLAPGTYYVSIRHYSASQTGSYGISVSAFPEIEVNGAEVQGGIDQPGETDTYQFGAAVAGNYTIETSGSTDTFLTLFGPDSPATVITVDDDSGSSLNSKITRSLAPGTYYVSIRHYSASQTGSYGISVSAFPEIEVNGAEVQGKIEQPGETDTYEFVATVSGSYTIETSGSTDTFLTLFGPNSLTTVITLDDDSGSSLNSKIIRNLAPGTYYTSLRHYSPTRTGNYGISVRRDPAT